MQPEAAGGAWRARGAATDLRRWFRSEYRGRVSGRLGAYDAHVRRVDWPAHEERPAQHGAGHKDWLWVEGSGRASVRPPWGSSRSTTSRGCTSNFDALATG